MHCTDYTTLKFVAISISMNHVFIYLFCILLQKNSLRKKKQFPTITPPKLIETLLLEKKSMGGSFICYGCLNLTQFLHIKLGVTSIVWSALKASFSPWQ